MIANPDGSIILTTAVDTAGIHKGTSNIKSDVNSASAGFRNLGKTIQNSLNSGNTKMASLANSARKATEAVEAQAQKVDELKNRYAQLQALSGLEQQRGALGSQAVEAKKTGDLEKYAELKAEIDKVTLSAIQMREALGMKETAITGQAIDNVNAKLSQEETKLRNLSVHAEIAGGKLRNANEGASASATAAGNAFEKFGKRISGLVKRVFIFSVITKALRALRGVISNVLKDDEEFAKSLNELKAALWVAFTPLLNVIIPALKTFINWLTIGITSLTKFIAALFNIPYSKLVADAKKMSAGAVKETKKAIKGQLAAFDELNTLDSGNDDTADAAKSLASAFESIGSFDMAGISAKLAELMEIIGGALIAIGVILLFLGHPMIGVAAIIAGLAVFSIGAAKIQETDPTQTPKKQLNDLMAVIGVSLVAIGIILLFFGNLPFGIGAIIAGITLLNVSAYSGEEGAVTQKITQWIKDNAGLIIGVGVALMVLGLILIIAGVLPIGIALMVAGAALVWTAVSIKWGDKIIAKVKSVTATIGKIITNLWEGIKKGFKAMVNGIISYANIWIDGLNLLLAPLRLLIVGIAKAFGKDLNFSQVKIPHIPKLAKGGIVPYQTLAMIGEQGKEAVLPLENNTGWMDMLADRLADRIGGGFNGKIEVPVIIDGREIARATRDAESRMGTQTVFGRFANAY